MFAPSHRIIKKIVQNYFTKKLSILDYGCGDGVMIDALGRDTIAKYDGYDVSNDSIQKAKNNFASKEFSFTKITALPEFSKNRYDLILLVGVLQYVSPEEVTMLLSKLRDALKSDGLVIMTTTSDHWLYAITDIYGLLLPHHRYTKEKIYKLVTTAGFKRCIVRERGLLLAPIFSHMIAPFLDAFDRIILRSKGGIGPVGGGIRKMLRPALYADFFSSKDYGYTSFIIVKK